MIFLVIVSLIHAYVGWRLIGPSTLRVPWRIVGALVLSAMVVLTIATFVGGRSELRLLPGFRVLQWIGYISIGFILVVFPLVLLRDMFWMLGRLAAYWSTESGNIDPGRRIFLLNASGAAALGAGALISSVGFAQARRSPQLKQVDVPIEGLPQQLDGFRIVQLTDVHVGPTIRGDFVRAVVETANAQNPEAIVITGDMIDGFVNELRPHVAPLADLRSTHGTFYVNGNHEYYWGAQAWIAEAKRLGMQPLLNEHRLIHKDGATLVMAGVTDYSSASHAPEHRSDPVRAVAGAPAEAIKILLAHQPRSLFAAQKAGYALQISGHTHGGQFFPWNFMVHLVQPVVAGLKKVGAMWVYVSRGTGYWGPPNRAGSPSEVTLLTLRRA